MVKRKTESLRSIGLTRIAVDKPTRAKLHELAGDMPLSHYLRGLAYGYIKLPKGTPQEPAPGFGNTGSPATIHSVAAGVAELRANTATREDYNRLELMISDIARMMGIKTLNTGVRAKVKKLAGSVPGHDNSQSELRLA